MVKDTFMVQINPNDHEGQMFSTCTLCVIKYPVTMHKIVAHFVTKVILFTITSAFFLSLICSKHIHVGSQHANVFNTVVTLRHFIRFCTQAL